MRKPVTNKRQIKLLLCSAVYVTMNNSSPNDNARDIAHTAEQNHWGCARVRLWWVVGATLLHSAVFSIPLTLGISQAEAPPIIDLMIITPPISDSLPLDPTAHVAIPHASIRNKKNVSRSATMPTLTHPKIETAPLEPKAVVDVIAPAPTRPSGADLLQQSIDMIRNNAAIEGAAAFLLEDISRRLGKSLPHDLTQADQVIALSQEEFESIKMIGGDTYVKVRMFGAEVCFNVTAQNPAFANSMNMPERMLVFMSCR